MATPVSGMPETGVAQTVRQLRSQLRKRVKPVTVPNTIHRPHPRIAKLLEADEERRTKVANSRFAFPWESPQFETLFERRRLRLLNALFTALQKWGAEPWVRGKEARETGVRVCDEDVSFSVDDANVKIDRSGYEYQHPRNPSGRMKVAIKCWRYDGSIRVAWEDDQSRRVEKVATEIVVELIAAAERQYREGAQRRYEWQCERKAQLIEEARRQREEAERKERERRAQMEKQRVERLLGDAAALRQARDIRAYVAEVQDLCAAGEARTDEETLRAWARWALAQADRIDPVRSGNFAAGLDDLADEREAISARGNDQREIRRGLS